MAEVKFCLKSLVAAIAIVLAMQVHLGSLTIEQHTQNWLVTSPVAGYLEKVASGAVLTIRNAAKSVSQLTSQAFGNPETQRASRLNLEFQRSPSSIKNQKSNSKTQDE